MTDPSEAGRADAWNPVFLIPMPGAAVAIYVVWTVVQPALDGVLLRETLLVGFAQWFLGSAVILGAVVLRRYREAAPYRAVVSAARAEYPDSLVFGICLDPITTPVGVQWGDSRQIRWGLIVLSSAGVRIVRSDGVVMLDRPWSEFEFVISGIDVIAGDEVEEWWFQPLSESGVLTRTGMVRRSRRRLLQLQAARPGAPRDVNDR